MSALGKRLSLLNSWMLSGASKFLAWLLGLPQIEAYYHTLPAKEGIAACAHQILKERGFCLEHIRLAAQSIPERGALLITSNHPTGILDGVLLFAALLSRRADIRVVANGDLRRISVLADRVIPMQRAGTGSRRDPSALFAIRRAWKNEECVIAFPAGTVAHWQWRNLKIEDAPWSEGIQRLAAKLSIPVCRATLSLRNPLWFHACAAFSRHARTALLARVFFAKTSLEREVPLSFQVLSGQPQINPLPRI